MQFWFGTKCPLCGEKVMVRHKMIDPCVLAPSKKDSLEGSFREAFEYAYEEYVSLPMLLNSGETKALMEVPKNYELMRKFRNPDLEKPKQYLVISCDRGDDQDVPCRTRLLDQGEEVSAKHPYSAAESFVRSRAETALTNGERARESTLVYVIAVGLPDSTIWSVTVKTSIRIDAAVIDRAPETT